MATKVTVPAKKKKGQTFSANGKKYKVGTRKTRAGGVKRVAVLVSASAGTTKRRSTKRRSTKKARRSTTAKAGLPSMRKAMEGKKIGDRFRYAVKGRKYEGIVVSGKGGKRRGCKIRGVK